MWLFVEVCFVGDYLGYLVLRIRVWVDERGGSYGGEKGFYFGGGVGV